MGYTDSDFAQSEDCRSTSGYCFKLNLNSALVSWKCAKQKDVVALSTVEAEYVAATEALRELLFLRPLLSDFTRLPQQTVALFCDSQGAIALAKHPVFHKRTKHIGVKYHAIRAHIAEKTVHLSYIPSKDNLADLFTKPLNGPKLRSFAIVRGIAELDNA